MTNKLEIIAEPTKPTIQTRRVVDAPRAVVWDAFTKPELIRRWMGPSALTLTVCEIDLRPGGKWHMVHRSPDGKTFGFHGEFREIEKPIRIVRTFVFEGWPDAEAVETLTLEEHGGKTTVLSHGDYGTVAIRDGHLKNGMEKGMTEGYERLDTLVASLA